MKKIILSVLSVLMIFGLIGCNGALHDYKDPEVFEGGTWYYYDVPTDAANVVFNVAGGNQSSDILGIDVSGGSIYYAWDSTVGKDNPGNNLVFEPGDKPAGQAGRVWCYTNAASAPNCYWWGCADGANDAAWPGKPMTKNGEAPLVEYTFTLKAIEIVGAPAIGGAGYYAFCEGWVPNNDWGAGTPNKVTSLTEGNAVLELDYDHTTSVPATLSIQILNPATNDDFWADTSKFGGGALSVNIPSDCDGKTYVWKIYATDFASYLVEVTE